jgi:hypothetical protein
MRAISSLFCHYTLLRYPYHCHFTSVKKIMQKHQAHLGVAASPVIGQLIGTVFFQLRGEAKGVIANAK